MTRKGRISHDRVEALEKRVAELEQLLEQLKAHPALSVPSLQVGVPAPNGYVPQFDRWPSNER